ncbi:hypothetical protein O3P69_018715 [Scylla paramamosain]|uniref:Uncharacterized protein n=1 Tax=Scylla paramamosain TaxID=85552 RepID=A0AAW0SRI1_SCYPA
MSEAAYGWAGKGETGVEWSELPLGSAMVTAEGQSASGSGLSTVWLLLGWLPPDCCNFKEESPRHRCPGDATASWITKIHKAA